MNTLSEAQLPPVEDGTADPVPVVVIKIRMRDSVVAVSSIRNRLLHRLRHPYLKQFIVLSRSRTGSGMLISMLNSHPQISAKGEIFARLEGRDPLELLKEALTIPPYWSASALGFKIFYYHPLDYEGVVLWNELQQMTDLRVIHLKRRSILRTLISRKRAERTDQWRLLAGETRRAEDGPIYFTVEELARGFAQTRQWECDSDNRFSNHAMLTLHYEDLVADPACEFRRITEFLDLPFVIPHTETRQQSSGKLKELIGNFGELSQAFSGTEWADQFID